MRQHFHYSYRLLFSLLALLPVVTTCEFEPDELQEKLIDKPSDLAPGILINLTPDTDTIKTDQNFVVIRFDAIVEPYRVNQTMISFDGERLRMNEDPLSGQAEIKLETWKYPEGLHQLNITIFTNSNSGSIADKVGAEGYYYTINWPLIIDRTPVKNIYFISVLPVERGVRLEWEKFDHPAFRNYTLKKYSYSSDDIELEITDPDKNFFIDTTYLEGERATYSIALNSWYGNSKEYIEFPEAPLISKMENFNVTVQWMKTRNPQMLDYYCVSLENDYPVYHPVNKIFSAEDTLITIDKIAFGKKYKLVLQYVPKASATPNLSSIYKGATEFMLGDSVQPHSLSRNIPGSDKVLLVKNDEVFAYDINSDSVELILNATFDLAWSINVSPSGHNFGYFSEGVFYLHNASTFETVISLPSSSFSGNRKYIYTVSDNNKLLVGYENGTLAVYDLLTGMKIAEKAGNNYQLYAKISPDGNFVMTRDYKVPTTQIYYKVVDSTLVEFARLTEPENARSRYFTFSPDGRLFLFYTDRVEIRDVLSFELLVQYNLPSGNVEAWDFDAGQLLVQDYYTEIGYLLDINSGELLKTMYVSGTQDLNMKGDLIISAYGRIMKISEITSQRHMGTVTNFKNTIRPKINKFLK